MRGWFQTLSAIAGLTVLAAGAVWAMAGDHAQIETNAAHARDAEKHWTSETHREFGALVERLEAVTTRQEAR